MTITFFGHASTPPSAELERKIMELLQKRIGEEKAELFLYTKKAATAAFLLMLYLFASSSSFTRKRSSCSINSGQSSE